MTNRTPPRRVVVTGAAAGLGRDLAARLTRHDHAAVVGVDLHRGDLTGVDWRQADVRDPAVVGAFEDADTVVHLAFDDDLDAARDERRDLNVRGTATVLLAAAAAGVRHVVLLTSAMVYGAREDNPLPLPDGAPLQATPDDSLVGDWLEMERLAADAARNHPGLSVAVLRPATLVGPEADSVLTRHFEAPRLLVVRGSTPRWQFCHVDDLLAALEVTVRERLDGPLNVGSEGWLEQDDVERVTGLRHIVLPAAVAFGTAERLHRIGVLPAPATELTYVAYPWVVSCERLTTAGWKPHYDNEAALRNQMAYAGPHTTVAGRRLDRHDATRAAAGATVALVGTVAVARARARRRRSG